MSIEPVGRHSRPAVPAQPPPPPGWYADPHMVGTRRYWNGQAWTDQVAMATVAVGQVYMPQQTSHLLHLVLSLLTCGLWIPIWILIAISNESARNSAMAQMRNQG